MVFLPNPPEADKSLRYVQKIITPSAIAVQLETARQLNALKGDQELDLAVNFVSFTLEASPAFGTYF